MENIEIISDPYKLFEKTLEKIYCLNPISIGLYKFLEIDSKKELKKKYRDKMEVPEKIKDTIIENLEKYNIEINYKYFDNIVLDNMERYAGLYNWLNDLIIINKNCNVKICTLEHEIIHKYIKNNFLNEKQCTKLMNDLIVNLILNEIKNIVPFYDENNEDLKFSGSAFIRFNEISANFISTKNYAERLKNKNHTWELNEFDRENLELLNKLEPINFALVELTKKLDFYKENNGINIYPRNKVNMEFIEKLEKTRDLPRTFEEFGEKYFPDLLKD